MKLVTGYEMFRLIEGLPIQPRVIDNYDELVRAILNDFEEAASSIENTYTKPRILQSLDEFAKRIEEIKATIIAEGGQES